MPKLPIFQAKNMSALDFMYIRRLNESLTNDVVKPAELAEVAEF